MFAPPRRPSTWLPRYLRHISAGSSNTSVKTSQFGSVFDEKNDVMTPFRNGASVAYLTIIVLSRFAQAFVVLDEKACDGGRLLRLSIVWFVDLMLTFELLLLCCCVMFGPYWSTRNQSVGYG